MGKPSREKGARGEREVADLFRKAGFDCNRVPNSGGLRLKGDLYGALPDLHVEVKRAERWDVPGWIRQAESEAPATATPIVCIRRNQGEWYAVLRLSTLTSYLRKGRHPQ